LGAGSWCNAVAKARAERRLGRRLSKF